MSFTFLKNLIEFLVSEEWFVNMRFTRRDMKMIEYLRDYEVVELKAMSEYLGVSVKTLKNQLKELSETLKEFGVDVQFVSSNQILVKGHEKFAEVMSVSILALRWNLREDSSYFWYYMIISLPYRKLQMSF